MPYVSDHFITRFRPGQACPAHSEAQLYTAKFFGDGLALRHKVAFTL
jgi:hypothetical protein